MNSLLDVPEIRQQAFPISVELYHRLAEGLPTELLRGTIIQKTSKSPFQVEVYRQPQPTGYTEKFVVSAPGVLECPGLPGVRVELGALFA
jgi:hypothetical protein